MPLETNPPDIRAVAQLLLRHTDAEIACILAMRCDRLRRCREDRVPEQLTRRVCANVQVAAAALRFCDEWPSIARDLAARLENGEL